MNLLSPFVNTRKERWERDTRVSYIVFFMILVSLFIPLLLIVPFSAGLNDGLVVVIKLDAIINVAAVELIKEGIDNAHRADATAIVLLLDTPGGLLDATFDI